MKILQVVPYFYPAWFYGGPAKLVYDTSCYMAEQGHEVTVYTSDAYDQFQRMPKKLRLPVSTKLNIHYFPNLSNSLAAFHNIFFTPALIFTAMQEIPRFDAIHLHDFYTLQNIIITLFAKLYHKPYIMSVHGCLEEQRMDRHSFFKKMYLFWVGSSILRGAQKVIATSNDEEKSYLRHGIKQNKIIRLAHGIQISEFQSNKSIEQARKEFKLPPDTVVITFLGRIHEIKGLDLLIKAAQQLRKQKVTFVIAGSDGGYLKELHRLIKNAHLADKIILRSATFGIEKADLYKASDIFVYPSYSEGFSLGILEAGAAGLPLVITTGCHFPEVQTQNAGQIVEPTAQALTAALKPLIASKRLRTRKGKQSQKLVQEQFSMSAVGQKLLRIYKTL